MAQQPKIVYMLLQVDGEETQLDTFVLLTSELHIQLPPAWVAVLHCETVELRRANGKYHASLFDERGCSKFPFDLIRGVLQQADTFGTVADAIYMKGMRAVAPGRRRAAPPLLPAAAAGLNAWDAFADALGKPQSELGSLIQKYFWESEGAVRAAEGGGMTPELAKMWFNEFKRHMSTVTKVEIKNTLGYQIGGLVATGDQGQTKSTLHVALRDADVLCAKVYYGGVDSAAMTAAQWEGTVSGRVHNNFQCTTIVEVERIIRIRNHILVMMPLLGSSASVLQAFNAPMITPISDRAAAVIALSVLSAIAALSQLELCHGDIKPSNIMLHSHLKDNAVLVDLASCMQYGQPLEEYTPAYGLDMAPIASLQWDMVCLTSTLFMLTGSVNKLPRSVAELTDVLDQGGMGGPLSPGRELCRALLQARSSSVDDLKLKAWEPCLAIVRKRIGNDLADALNARWPVRKVQGVEVTATGGSAQ